MARLLREPTLRVALVTGFGLTLGVWLFLGYQVARNLATAQREAQSQDARYVQAQERLSEVRSGVLLASVIIRDALLNSTPQDLGVSRRAIDDAYSTIETALAGYAPVFGSAEEQNRFAGLTGEVQAFRKASEDILATDRRRWPTDGQNMLRRFLPLRERAITVSEEAQSVNRALYVAQRRATADGQSALQSQILQGLGAAIVLSLVIAWLAFRHATGLEARLREQHAREGRISADLQRLSARLTDMQEEAQRRIARELHDEVGQGLSAVQLELTVAQKRLERLGVSGDFLLEARSVAESVLGNVRDLSQLLHPSVLDDLGLSAALDSYVTAFTARTGIAVDLVDRTHAGRVSRAVEVTVYRVVQEALNNTLKHAQASQVVISLSRRDDILQAVIEDDGEGFNAEDAERPGRRRGLGLLGIRERVTQLGGSWSLSSTPGRGTRLEINLPTATTAVDEPATPSDLRLMANTGGTHG